MNLDLYNFHLRSPAPFTNLQSSNSSSITVSASQGYISHPLTASPGTTGNASGLLGNAATATLAVRVMGTTLGVSCPFLSRGCLLALPLGGWGGDSTEGIKIPTAFYVHSVSNLVSAPPDQQHGLPYSVAVLSSDSPGSPSCSRSFIFSISASAFSHPVAVIPVSGSVGGDYPDQCTFLPVSRRASTLVLRPHQSSCGQPLLTCDLPSSTIFHRCFL